MLTRKLKFITGILVVATVVSSCKKDLLEVFPSDSLSDVTAFSDLQGANRVLTNVYGTMPNGFSRRDQNPGDAGWSRGMSAFAMATDDAEANNLAASTHALNQGQLETTWAYADDIWVQQYAVIRKANSFMERIDAVPGDAAVKAGMKAEALFLRAFAYAELVKTFGGVPLILNAGLPEEAIIPRNTYQECIDQIIADCDGAAAVLPVVQPASELGRATKVAALAVKARMLLHYASPLNNEANATDRWTAAAAAAKDVMAYGPAPGSGVYGLHPDYYRLFMDKAGNKEVIFARKFQNPSINPSDGARNKWYFSANANDGAWGGFSPTQNLVDAYEMKNGLPITDPASGYDDQAPYTDRDSRLDKSIIHNGTVYKAGKVIETFRGGNSNLSTNPDTSKTGYGLLKLVDTSKYGAAGNADNDWIFIRYAEVLLNYAEARNEAQGAPDASVYDAINQVRFRAGQPNLPAGLTKDQMRERIRNERRVELSFEEHRFFDVRRWKLGEVYFKEPARKVSVVKLPDNSLRFNYQILETRDYKPFMDRLPIPQNERDKNNLLTQNPGYN